MKPLEDIIKICEEQGACENQLTQLKELVSNNQDLQAYQLLLGNFAWLKSEQIDIDLKELCQLADCKGIRIEKKWQDNAWVNNCRYTSTYDANGNQLTYLREDWQNNAWVNDYRYTSTYDANGNRLTGLREDWRNNEWVEC